MPDHTIAEASPAYAVESPPVVPPPFPYGSTGRPSKYTPDTIAALLAAIAQGNKILNACKLAGVTYETYSTWRKASDAGDPRFVGFSEQVDQAEASAEARLLGKIEDASAQDWKAAGWIMARRFGWVDESRLTVDHTGTVTNAIEITVLTSNDLGGIAGLLGTGTPGILPPGDVIDQEPDPQP